MTWVNQLHFGYDELPFGGVKESGMAGSTAKKPSSTTWRTSRS